MSDTTWYYRYLIADTDVGKARQFWGDTDQFGDDPTCEYTTVLPIPYNVLAGEYIIFNGQEWILITADNPS